MDSKFWMVILIAVAAFSALRVVTQWRGLSRKRRPVDWDEQFIQQLRKAGVNTFQEQPVDFFFTLPSRQACEQLAFTLRPDGYALDIREDPEAHTFSLHAQRDMRLIIPEMQALTVRFNQLAAQHGGTYDNWAVARR